MTVEVVNVIGDFDVTLPANGDFLNEGDDHIRNVKKGVLGSFAGKMDNVITTSDDQFNYLNNSTSSIQDQLDAITTAVSAIGSTPIGGIIMYNGAFSAIAANFQLCDGTNGTPNLTDQFILGANLEIELGNTGGSADAVLVSHSHTADHDHTASSNEVPDHQHDVQAREGNATGAAALAAYDEGVTPVTYQTDPAGAFTPTITVDSQSVTTSTDGVSATDANLPPFYKLAFIRRMS